jgi:hypothetical protein
MGFKCQVRSTSSGHPLPDSTALGTAGAGVGEASVKPSDVGLASRYPSSRGGVTRMGTNRLIQSTKPLSVAFFIGLPMLALKTFALFALTASALFALAWR